MKPQGWGHGYLERHGVVSLPSGIGSYSLGQRSVGVCGCLWGCVRGWGRGGGTEVVRSTGGDHSGATPAMSVIYHKCVLTDGLSMCDDVRATYKYWITKTEIQTMMKTMASPAMMKQQQIQI